MTGILLEQLPDFWNRRHFWSKAQPEGAVTMARIVNIGKGKRLIQIVQTKGNQASQVTLDAKEYRALVAFASRKKRRR